MITRRFLLASAAALAFASPAFAQEKLNVIATFSILGDIVANVGGDRVTVTSLVGPDGDAHVFQPAPADARAVAGADVIVANGLGFEGWMDRLIEASGSKATVITASEGVEPRAFDEEEHEEDEAVLWPFDGAQGPMGRGPMQVAWGGAAMSPRSAPCRGTRRCWRAIPRAR